jgi:hypothetical protein
MKSLWKDSLSPTFIRTFFASAFAICFAIFILTSLYSCSVSRPRTLDVNLSGQVDDFHLRDSSNVVITIKSSN